jgi:hypothetical protein
VAAGAALLFGVNAFCLDGSGSLWLSTLPDWERRAMWAKTQVVAEVTLLSVAASLAGGLIRVPAPQHAGEVTATVAAALVATGLVVSSSLRAAVSSPHRADLRGPRDTPAPPGVMALHSLRLAVLTTFVGLFFSGLAFIPVWWFPLVAAVPFLAWSGLSLVETGRTWADPTTRARIVITVSGG